MARLSDTELKALLSAEKADALGGVGSSRLATERSDALAYYMGDMSKDMPAQDGRSKAVSTDVSDTIEGLMPSLMEVFTSADDVVRFAPVGPEDMDAAEQETDYVNHVFMQKNPGFLVLYSFIKDALLSKVGIVKVWYEKGEKEERETYIDLSDQAFQIIVSDPEVDIVKHSMRPDPSYQVGEGMPSEEQPVLHDVELVKRKEYGCSKVEGVPPEEFGISKRARSMRDADYCYHEVYRTEAELIDQGYDDEQVRTLATTAESNREESFNRDTVEERGLSSSDANRATRTIKVTEHYCRMAYEDGEKPRLYRITTGGEEEQVLKRDGKPDVVPVDMMPFAAMTPVIVTHRFYGRSIADLVMDLQRMKTSVMRSWLDNMYLANNQRIEVAESHAAERTLDDLLVNRPGGIVRTKQPGGILPIPNQSIGDKVMPLIEYLDMTREWRTGVTRQGQGIDANALQNQTATAVSQTYSAAQAKMRLIARIFAETGIRDMFSLLHATIRKNEREAQTVRLRNKWVTINPRDWKTREDLTIEVGLGSGSKAEQIGFLMQVLQVQREILMAPQQVGLATPKNVYNTLEKLIERTDLKTIEPYFTDPEQSPPQEPPPDPKMVEVQQKIELEREKAKAQIELQREKYQAEGQMRAEQMKAEVSLELQKMRAEMMLEMQRMAAEQQLARQEMVLNVAQKREAADKQASLGATRLGGEIG